MKTLTALAAVLATTVTLPASAGAASATITGDGGEALALPVSIRNMSPVVTPSFSESEKRFTIRILGPDGSTEASIGQRCSATSSVDPQNVTYLGNGTYTVQIQTSADDSIFCDTLGPAQVSTFTIAASTALTVPGATLPLRKLNDAEAIEHVFGLAPNPGRDGYVVAYARDGKIGADGGISGDPLLASVNNPTETSIRIDFPGPGRYTLVARATRRNARSGWSAPVSVNVVAPFDFDDGPYLRDSRGPSYEIQARVREPSVAGATLVVSIARGKGAFKRFVTTKVRADRRIRIRFKQQRRGNYRFRYVFKGSSTVTAGTVVQKATLY